MADNGMLLHVCCAPCLASTRATIRLDRDKAYPDIAEIYFFNPNIHPLLEFRRRQKALQVYLERDALPAEINGDYGLEPYLRCMVDGGQLPTNRRDRCYRCYLLRFSAVADRCVATGVGCFSTTLQASREQDRDLIAEAGREVAAARNLEFLKADFRLFQPEERMLRGLYRQQYCGCIFSEEERWRGTGKHLYRRDEENS